MKKQFKEIFTATVLGIMLLTSCSNQPAEETVTVTETEETTVAAETTTAETTIETTTTKETTTTETTTESETETTPEEPQSAWKKLAYVDEFNRPTDNYYLCCNCIGTFSNSTVSNEELIVQVTISHVLRYSNGEFIGHGEKLYFTPYEYGKYKINGILGKKYEHFDLKILEEDGNIVCDEIMYYSGRSDFGVVYYKEDDEKYLDYKVFFDALLRNDKVTVSANIPNVGNYVFDVDCTGLAEQYEELEYYTDYAT